MKPIEKLAREICWVGYSKQVRAAMRKDGKTRASYWKSLPESTRQNYIQDAQQFAFLYRSIDIEVLNQIGIADDGP